MTARIVTTVHRYKRARRRNGRRSRSRHTRFPEQSANTTTYWLSTNIELKKAPITLHVEGCSILRRSRWRNLRGPDRTADVGADRGITPPGSGIPDM